MTLAPGEGGRRRLGLALALAGLLAGGGGLAAQDSVQIRAAPDSVQVRAGPDSVQVRAAPARYPHEPAGFQRFAEFDGSAPPLSREPAPDGLAGRWYNNQAAPARSGQRGSPSDRPAGRPPQGVRLREDPSAPQSPPGVLAMVYPRGFKAGVGPANWGGWDLAGDGPEGQKRAIYLSMWLKLDKPDYENHAVGTKFAFIGVGMPPNAPGQSGNQILLFIKGLGRSVPGRAFQVQLYQYFTKEAGAPFLVNREEQNASRAPLMTAGKWHHWELVMSLNDPGVPNGKFRWWIDGKLVMDFRDRLFRPRRGRAGFWNLKINPTWGGMGGQKTREDAILVDHVYLSGLPFEARAARDSE